MPNGKQSRKEELKKAKAYFKKHPKKIKYSRKESGLSSSYLKKPDGSISRLVAKSEEKLLGEGQFGRVKIAHNKRKTSAVKIQRINKLHEEDKVIARNEAIINEDLRIATGSLMQREEEDKEYITFYQEMHRLGHSVKDKLSEMTFNQKINIAIDMLLAINNLHNGRTSKTQTPFAHGDIHLGNVVFSGKNQLALIDFSYTKSLVTENERYTNSLINEDIKQALISIHQPDVTKCLFTHNEFNLLPDKLKAVLTTNDDKLSLKHIASLLVAYKINPQFSEDSFSLLYPSPLKVLEIFSEMDYKYGHEISAAQ